MKDLLKEQRNMLARQKRRRENRRWKESRLRQSQITVLQPAVPTPLSSDPYELNPISKFSDFVETHSINSEAERQVASVLSSFRQRFYRKGWPDFLVDTGEKLLMVEVKGPKDKLREEQQILHKVLEKYGLTVVVIYTGKEGWQEELTKYFKAEKGESSIENS